MLKIIETPVQQTAALIEREREGLPTRPPKATPEGVVHSNAAGISNNAQEARQ
jgi:hypothetical protein